MAGSGVCALRTQICRLRCRYFSRSIPCSSQDDMVEKQPEKQTNVSKEKKAREASKRLLDLISQLKVDGSITNKDTELNRKLSRPRNHKEQAKENTLLSLKLEEKEKFADIDPPLASAVQSVAASIGGDTRQTESELIKALRSYKTETERAKVDLRGLISSMKVERKSGRTKEEAPSRKPQPPRHPQGQELAGPVSREVLENGDLFGGAPLGIFKKKQLETKETEVPKTMWDRCEERELNYLLLAPPANAFEEIIRWTEQGKMWKFPIDNEQGMEKEQSVPFHDHVFLERHLKDGFPQIGPVRHFMELVCVGLSKNPYMTVERKLEHIEWYREYFQRKEADLQELEVVKDQVAS